MRRALLGGLVSLTVTFTSAPWVRRHLVHRGALDIPNHRSSHVEPVPRGGGLACLSGIACGVIAAGPQSQVTGRVIAGIGALAAVGLVDDRTGHVSAKTRLVVQCFSGALLSPSGSGRLPISALATPGVVNVVNFMDGVNGITASTAAVWGISTLLNGRASGDHALQTFGAVTAGAGLGFLPWNAPTACLFLGDVGSYLFGGLMAAAISQALDRPSLAWRVAAPLLPYGVDAAATLARRVGQGRDVSEAHRQHAYQRLVDEHGMTHVQVAAAHAVVATAVAALARHHRTTRSTGLALLIVGAYATSPDWLAQRKAKPSR